MVSARDRLASIRAKEKQASQGDHGSYTLPPDYQDIIKAAQAEERSARQPATAQSGDKWNGLREAGGSTRNVPRPSSRSEALSANEADGAPVSRPPIPTARSTATSETSTAPSSADSTGADGSNILKLLGAAGMSAAAAYALYKMAAKGDPEAIADIKAAMGEAASNDAQSSVNGDKTARISAEPDAPMLDNRRFGDEIIDADYEDVTDRRMLSNVDATIDDVDGVARAARPTNYEEHPVDAPQARLAAPAPDENIDAMIARQIEGDEQYVRSEQPRANVDPQAVVEGRTGRLRGRPEVPRPRIKPRT